MIGYDPRTLDPSVRQVHRQKKADERMYRRAIDDANRKGRGDAALAIHDEATKRGVNYRGIRSQSAFDSGVVSEARAMADANWKRSRDAAKLGMEADIGYADTRRRWDKRFGDGGEEEEEGTATASGTTDAEQQAASRTEEGTMDTAAAGPQAVWDPVRPYIGGKVVAGPLAPSGRFYDSPGLIDGKPSASVLAKEGIASRLAAGEGIGDIAAGLGVRPGQVDATNPVRMAPAPGKTVDPGMAAAHAAERGAAMKAAGMDAIQGYWAQKAREDAVAARDAYRVGLGRKTVDDPLPGDLYTDDPLPEDLYYPKESAFDFLRRTGNNYGMPRRRKTAGDYGFSRI